MSENGAKPSPEAKRQKQGRSPAYPGLSLKASLEKAKAQYDAEGKYQVPLASAFQAWGYSDKSSGGRDVRASLRYFGLITVEGDGDTAKVKLTEDALRVLLDAREDQTEKKAIIRRLALNPTAHKKLWSKFPDGIKSDPTATHYLMFDEGFNKSAAEALIAEYKETATFSGLYEPAPKLDKPGEKDDKDADKPLPKLKVGDKVQVTVDRTDMFADGATIIGFSEDGAWVFIDQSDSAAKIEEVSLLHTASEPPVLERPPVPAHLLKKKEEQLPKAARKAVFPLSDGDVTLTFPENISDAGLKRLKRYLEIFLDEEIDNAKKIVED